MQRTWMDHGWSTAHFSGEIIWDHVLSSRFPFLSGGRNLSNDIQCIHYWLIPKARCCCNKSHRPTCDGCTKLGLRQKASDLPLGFFNLPCTRCSHPSTRIVINYCICWDVHLPEKYLLGCSPTHLLRGWYWPITSSSTIPLQVKPWGDRLFKVAELMPAWSMRQVRSNSSWWFSNAFRADFHGHSRSFPTQQLVVACRLVHGIIELSISIS